MPNFLFLWHGWLSTPFGVGGWSCLGFLWFEISEDDVIFRVDASLIVDLFGGSLRMDCSLLGFAWWWALFIYGEFDPGSGRTLAACLTHASRTMMPSLLGGLVANG